MRCFRDVFFAGGFQELNKWPFMVSLFSWKFMMFWGTRFGGPNPYPAAPRSELRKRRFEAVESAATEVAEGGNIMGGNWAMIIVMVRDVVEKSAQNDRID